MMIVKKLYVEPNYILKGTGPITLEKGSSMLNDPVLEYETLSDKYSNEAIGIRIKQLVDDDKANHSLSFREYCKEILRVNYSHLHGVMTGTKPVSSKLLMHMVRYGKYNLNYVMAGAGKYFITEDKQP